jgi:hypothetical protein
MTKALVKSGSPPPDDELLEDPPPDDEPLDEPPLEDELLDDELLDELDELDELDDPVPEPDPLPEEVELPSPVGSLLSQFVVNTKNDKTIIKLNKIDEICQFFIVYILPFRYSFDICLFTS